MTLEGALRLDAEDWRAEEEEGPAVGSGSQQRLQEFFFSIQVAAIAAWTRLGLKGLWPLEQPEGGAGIA